MKDHLLSAATTVVVFWKNSHKKNGLTTQPVHSLIKYYYPIQYPESGIECHNA